MMFMVSKSTDTFYSMCCEIKREYMISGSYLELDGKSFSKVLNDAKWGMLQHRRHI